MREQRVLVVGGGIGGLTAAIALRQDKHDVVVIERDPTWSVYGVGIIQQANVVRAMAQLGLLDEYLQAGVPFDKVAIHAPNGDLVAELPSPKLDEAYPPNIGISRRALHQVLVDRARSLGVDLRQGVTIDTLEQDARSASVTFSDGRAGSFDFVVGADGIYSAMRQLLFPDAGRPQFTGQAVWRYNLPRPADLDALHVYNGPTGIGLVPMSRDMMYMFVTTPEPGNPQYPQTGLAQTMRRKLDGTSPPARALGAQIRDDKGVVYRPLEHIFLDGPWHRGRIVLLGDAVHATTPHLGQGAGMAIEDSIVLAEEIARHDSLEDAFIAYRERRIDRCRFICDLSLAICNGQLGKGPPVDNVQATAAMFARTAEPI